MTISENADKNTGVVLINYASILKKSCWQVDGNIYVLQKQKLQYMKQLLQCSVIVINVVHVSVSYKALLICYIPGNSTDACSPCNTVHLI